MKKIFTLFAAIILALQCIKAQNIFPSTGSAGIGTAAPNASSLLEMISTTKGFLPPRMTLAQRNAIASPAAGLLIYQTNSTPGLYYYSGTVWSAVSAKSANTSLSNLKGPTAINASLLPAVADSINIGSATLPMRSAWFSRDATINGIVVGTGGGSNSFNTALGNGALFSNTTGSSNTSAGFNTLRSNTTGYYNSAYGSAALTANTTGYFNTAYGAASLVSNTTGYNNTATGYSTLSSNTTGSFNIANGDGALKNNTIGSHNIAIGSGALYTSTGGSSFVAIGDSALFNQNGGPGPNTAVGYKALFANITGYNNNACGVIALFSNTYGTDNTATGAGALSSNTLGSYNTANGTASLGYNIIGIQNTATGANALNRNISSGNTANGFGALLGNTTGSNNTALGIVALYDNSTGNNNTAVGSYTDVFTGNLSNASAFGSNAVVDASDKVRIGNASVTSIGGQVGWTNFSDSRIKKNIKENVPGLAFINLLKPVTYNFSLTKEYELTGRKDSAEWKTKYDIEKINFTGFVAQDVDAAAKKIKYDFSGIDKTGKIMGLRYAEFVVPLVKAVQELSKSNDDKDAKINALELRIEKMEAMLNMQSLNTNNNQALNPNLVPSLEQNIPNPFNHSTTINYTLPQQCSNAKIIIADNTGKSIKEINVTGTIKGSVMLDATTLSVGTYHYSLCADGKILGSKQMVLTK